MTWLRVLRAVCVVVAVASPVLTIASVWWWALHGMDHDVGLAWFVTIAILGLGGGFGAAFVSVEIPRKAKP